MTHQTFPKSRPKLLDKREARAERAAIDRTENVIVKQRSGGQCEVRIAYFEHGALSPDSWRCRRRACHVHHLRSGLGIRNRGASITAACKLHVCELHHTEIHGHVLKPVNEATRYDATTIRYERVT